MLVNKTVYPDVDSNSYITVTNSVMDYNADEPLEHSIFYAGSVSENVQFCDETNYTYTATAPNCQFTVTPKNITKADIFFLSRGYRFFNLDDNWEYRTDQTYKIVTSFDVSNFYFDLNQITCQIYDLSQPDGGHAIGSATNMSFTDYRNQTAEYKKTHLIRSITGNYIYGDNTSICKYKGVANYYDVNVSPMIRYVFNDKTTIYAPIILNSYGVPDWGGPSNLNNLTGSGTFPQYASDIYSNSYTYFGKWFDGFVSGGSAHMVTAANIGSITNFTVHAANDLGQQVTNGYHIPDISGIDTNKYMIPVFVWGNSWNKRIVPFFTDEFLMRYFASFGLRFKVGDTMYIGFMNADGTCNGDYILESELATSNSANRNITDFTASNYDANIPYTPPTSGDVKNKTVEMPTGYITGTAGMVNYIEINRTGLASADDISEALSRFDIATIGKDLLRNLISFKCFAVLNINDSVTRQIKIGGYPLTDENEQPLQGKYIGGLAPSDIDDITIPTLYNDYRDYAPYTSIQMYVPFCGWFDLPSWCIGKTITGDVYTDLYNGTMKVVVFAHDAYTQPTVVAEVGGCCAFDIPFVAESTGMKASAVISSALTTAAAVGASIATPNVATGIAAVSSAANLISAANMNTTTLKGVLGDGSNLNGLLHVYIKVSRPQSPTHNTGRPNSYKHEYGIPCFKEITLQSGDGFTQVNDAQIIGTMTATEKQMIIDGFRHGLIL